MKTCSGRVALTIELPSSMALKLLDLVSNSFNEYVPRTQFAAHFRSV